jgi:hypothetical protein
MCKYKDTTLGIKKLDFNVKRGAMAVFYTDALGMKIMSENYRKERDSWKAVSRDKEYEQKAEGGLYDNG